MEEWELDQLIDEGLQRGVTEERMIEMLKNALDEAGIKRFVDDLTSEEEWEEGE